ncbi:MAG: DUF2254 domain-containing protein [Polyangiaceae bacterium]
MSARLERVLDQVRTGFWFVPLVMFALASALALVVLHIDAVADPGIKSALGWAYTGGPEGARSLLSTIAGSMITAASVTFSLASVALSLASQQYGSRVLRNFMRDRITQILLGTFISTFVYCVLVVRTIRGTEFSGGFVPAISVTVALALALASLVLLVFFIHHVSASIQASHILGVIGDSTREAILKLYPSQSGRPRPESEPAVALPGENVTVLAGESGYVQTIDVEGLIELARKRSFIVELVVGPGDHLVPGMPIAKLRGTTDAEPELVKAIRYAVLLGRERTPTQDIRYQFQQLSDVVVRALSPGINDPFTALNGIDELAAGLAQMTTSDAIPSRRYGPDGALCVVAPAPSVSDVLDETVGHIAIYGAGDRFVVAGLRRVLAIVEDRLPSGSGREEATIRRLRSDIDERARVKSA